MDILDCVGRTEWRALTRMIRQGVLVACVTLLVICGSPVHGEAKASTSAPEPIPAGLSAAEWGNIQSAVERATYQVSEGTHDSHHTGALEAANVRHKLRTEFTPEGVHIVPTGQRQPAWQWGMTLRAYGYEGDPITAEAVQPIADGNRVEYRRGPLVEWYVNDGRGLEQGFTLTERPSPSDGTPLLVDLDVIGSLVPQREKAGTAVQFVTTDGQPVLRYGGLVAWDATGKKLPARLLVEDYGVRLLVEDQAAVYPLTIDPTIINESAKLLASDGTVSDLFGFSVAMMGDTVVVGAWGDDTLRGAAYVFAKPVGGWTGSLTEIAKLLASDGAGGDHFGISVAMAGDHVVVASEDDSSGSAYLFVRPAGGWTGSLTETAKLLASDGVVGHRFGSSVAMAGDHVVVGAWGDNSLRGAAYVFAKPVGGWTGSLTETAKLLASDRVAGDRFGSSVAMAGDHVVVGAWGDNSFRGAAYVFAKPVGGWTGSLTEIAKLLAYDGVTGDRFGWSVALAGDHVVVGASEDDSSRGSAYLFVRPAGGWTGSLTENAKLLASDGAGGDYFGWSVALAGDHVVVGAWGDDTLRGAAYVFVKPVGGWIGTLNESAKLLASDGVAFHNFGRSVAIAGGSIVVGEPSGNSSRGSVYLFNLVSDSDGPVTSNVLATPNPISITQNIILSATIDDSTTGGSTIAAATYEIRNSAGSVVQSGAGDTLACAAFLTGTICPTTTGFDEVQETVATSVAAGTLAAGVYDLCVRGQDAKLNLGAFACNYLVVYDPTGSFVTGGGWIQSSPGFCTLTALCESAQGKANFGFVSKYKKGATVPSGQTQFEFTAGRLDFHSTAYEWLVVGGPLAQFKGSGTINGLGDYGFLLSAKDSAVNGGPPKDTFRIKIWDKGTGLTVYDNGTDQPIGGGSIVIH